MRPRGFALLLVLLTLAIVGALVWDIGAWARQRTLAATHALRDAQLEQLMLAGTELAPQVLGDAPPQLQVRLPAELDGQLTLQRISGQNQVRITAQCGGAQRQELAGYTRTGGAWRLAELRP